MLLLPIIEHMNVPHVLSRCSNTPVTSISFQEYHREEEERKTGLRLVTVAPMRHYHRRQLVNLPPAIGQSHVIPVSNFVWTVSFNSPKCFLYMHIRTEALSIFFLFKYILLTKWLPYSFCKTVVFLKLFAALA